MRILMVSMNSIHFVRWTQQLENSGHEVFWFDILDGGRAEGLPWVHQYTGWKQKYPKFKGRYFFKKRFPLLYKIFSFLFEDQAAKTFEKVLQEVKPDVVHSFVLYISCVPILKVMQKHNQIPWLYSSWGSDLFYFKNFDVYKKDIQRVLPRINFLITDCKRDVSIAKDLGFKGVFLGTFPGGGGFDFTLSDHYTKPVSERKSILVKGYQGRSGRAIHVLKALELCYEKLTNFDIVVFGADEDVEAYIKENSLTNKFSMHVLPRNQFLPHQSVLKLMGEALIYVGNSNSDGMPNTLLEAIIQGAFPIQSNPGGATSEVITHGKNGFLIEDCNNADEIKTLILHVISNRQLFENAFKINQNKIKPQYERRLIKNQVLKAYQQVLSH